MKRTIFSILPLAFVLCLTGCGFEEVESAYTHTSVLFTYQNYNRELVVGEGLSFKPGVVFAGLDRSDRDRVVNYEIDPSLVPEGKTLLPEEYYISDNPSQFVVKKGDLKGYIRYTLDSAKFVADPKALTGEYVLPFRITSADADSITTGKESMVVSLKYLAKQFGNYTYVSKVTNTETGEVLVNENIKGENASIRTLTTLKANRLLITGDPKVSGDPARKLSITLTLAPTDAHDVIIGNAAGATIKAKPNGDSSYDEATKTFTLNYKYSIDDVIYEAQDIMTFRNRIRDRQDSPNSNVYIDEWEGF